MQYVRIRSWHIVLTATRVPDMYRTLCGKNAQGPTSETEPFGEKSCETCLRLAVRKVNA